MARTIAPLLSFGASGAIAKTQVYAKWKGRPYARRYIIPANPNTLAQQATRSVFKWLNDAWKYMPGSAVTGWDAYALASQITSRNGWLKQNVASLIAATDLSTLIFSPSAKSGIQAAGMTVTAGVGQLTVDLTAPTLPTGWTITEADVAAIADQDPHSGTNFQFFTGSDATSPYQVILTGLTAAQLYRVGGWFKFTRQDGTFAYGQSFLGSGTPT